MLPGVNKKQVEQAMKRMGMRSEEIDATEVIIRTPTKEIVISNPQVSKINMMGQESFQIGGDVTERALSGEPELSEDDIETVMSQAGAPREEALSAIKAANGDLAQAIMDLKK